MPPDLNAEGYDTDKCELYLQHYERWFAPLRLQPVRLLEVGIDRGGSLLLWRDYFQHGLIAGLDIEPKRIPDATGRVHVYHGPQDDLAILDRIGNELGPFDIVIDDASHLAAPTRTTFWHLFEHYLKPGGLYVIEDWGTGYWESWPDGRCYEQSAPHRSETGTGGQGHGHGMVGFVKELVDECGVEDLTRPGLGVAPYRSCPFQRMEVSPGQVLVVKQVAPG